MIDLCRNLSNVDLSKNRSLFDKFSCYYFFQIIKLMVLPCFTYVAYIYILKLNNINVVFGYRNITIPMFIFFALFIFPCYQFFVPIFKERRKLSFTLNRLTSDDSYNFIWKEQLLSSTYITVLDLILAKKFNILSSNEYSEIKSQYIKQNLKEIATKKNKMFMYVYNDKEHFAKFGESNVDNLSFIHSVELKLLLEISDEEFAILKRNFINNNALVDLYDLESLRRLNIIDECEYFKKLYNIELERRLRSEWKTKILITNFIIVFIVGIITFTISK